MYDNIFLALSNKKIAVSIAKMILSEGIKITQVVKNAFEINNVFPYYQGGIIITSCFFDGVHIDNMLADIPEGYTVILIGTKEQLNECDDQSVFKLATPLHKNDIICALDMIMALDSNYSPTRVERDSEEKKLLLKAKQTLMDAYSMTEEQAHRYIQKKSMDSGRKLGDIARIILEI